MVEEKVEFLSFSGNANQEAKSSKNYIYELSFRTFADDAEIGIKHGNYESSPGEAGKGYTLRFEKQIDKNVLKCINPRYRHLWETEVDTSMNLILFAFEQFKNILKFYQKTVKKVFLNLTDSILQSSDDIDFGVENLNNLEALIVLSDTDVRKLLSKTRKNLKSLYVAGWKNGKALEDCEQIFQVQKLLDLQNTRLNNDQLQRLSPSICRIPIGKLTECDIFNFIWSWQNGTIRNTKLKNYEWYLIESKFDIKMLFRLFGKEYNGGIKSIDINHEKEVGKRATLEYAWVVLKFKVID